MRPDAHRGEPRKIALFTVIYPGVEPFLGDWHRSVIEQTDRQFDLWIASDMLPEEDASEAMGRPAAQWVHAKPAETPAQLRNRVLAEIVETVDAVILVDSDDILLPRRVEAARHALADSDLNGCALHLVDARGRDLGATFASIDSAEAQRILPRWNAFGFSNSAYRSGLLKQCLPVPDRARLIDWFVATQAWLLGAKLSFDPTPRMYYRRHEANTAPALGPFASDRIIRDTRLVLEHFELASSGAMSGHGRRSDELNALRSEVATFSDRVIADPAALDAYALALNALTLPPVWWTSVAHPALSHLWN
jgi:hypothetical protein